MAIVILCCPLKKNHLEMFGVVCTIKKAMMKTFNFYKSYVLLFYQVQYLCITVSFYPKLSSYRG
jgi:hypothetical protein